MRTSRSKAKRDGIPSTVIFSDIIFTVSVGMIGLLVLAMCLDAAWGSVDDDDRIGFVWQPPENAQTAVSFYQIYLSVNGGPYKMIDETRNTYYVVPGDSGSTYRIRVAGVNVDSLEGPLSPESDEVLCLPQDEETIVFGFAAIEAQEAPGQLKIVWETTSYLDPAVFQIRRRKMSHAPEQLLDVEVHYDLNSDAGQSRYWCMDRNVEIGETYQYSITAMDPNGYGALAISLYAEVRGPQEYRLHQNYPNPFNAETTISFQNPRAQRVVITIFNTKGQKVSTLMDAVEAPGLHLVHWDGTDHIGLPVASGVYFCHMLAGDFADVRKMAVVR
jgi:hypothetical protein